MNDSMLEVLRQAIHLREQGTPYVLCTLIACRGHAPQEPGAKALITADGLVAGTIGGGKLEARAILDSQQILKTETVGPRLADWDLKGDLAMTCGGSVRLLWEPFGLNPWSITVFGAGHVAQALTRILVTLDCRITCVDQRPEWIARLPQSPRLKTHVTEDLADVAATVASGTYCVVVTKGHCTDFGVLETLLRRSDLPFVGSIGSSVKARALRADLARAGLTDQEINRLHCPIGILSSRAPEEIAISIAAQLIHERQGAAQPTIASADRIRRQGFATPPTQAQEKPSCEL